MTGTSDSAEDVQLLELVQTVLAVGESQTLPQVRREPDCPGEDRQRQPRDDLVARSVIERNAWMQRQRRARERRRDDGERRARPARARAASATRRIP